MSALIEAAHRNVQCSSDRRWNQWIFRYAGRSVFSGTRLYRYIEVKVYNPVNLLKPWTMQARLHDKYVITDSSMYLLGGRKYDQSVFGRLWKASEY